MSVCHVNAAFKAIQCLEDSSRQLLPVHARQYFHPRGGGEGGEVKTTEKGFCEKEKSEQQKRFPIRKLKVNGKSFD